ncbi:MAG TPA: methylmalonyl Co-A mutase-associated GTPase MeaB [Dehalococcoidia bacterium]|nr:methylmalonyl Co-A mutase-associated GTPase MeaB [Dehalococcoidia bacterium]
MSRGSDAGDLVRRLLGGERRALSRAISEVENESATGLEALRLLYPHTGRAQSIGITGSAGAGKSTLTAVLAKAFRAEGRTVAVIAVDPSSPFSHGALLGDRIRMQDLTNDPGTFIRSMATRGSAGGLAATAADVAAVFDAAGRDIVIIETVGAGQDEVKIASVAQTTLVLNTPGMGDDIQAIKAGIIEIADVLVVNKADLPGADAVEAQLQALLSLAPAGDWQIPVVKVSATKSNGIQELLDAIATHRAHLQASKPADSARYGQARRQILAAVHAELERRLRIGELDSQLDSLAAGVAERTTDPRSAAVELLQRINGQWVKKGNASEHDVNRGTC